MKILLIRFSSIGDIVLTTPVIRCIKNKYPHAELHFVTKKVNAHILEANPYLHKRKNLITSSIFIKIFVLAIFTLYYVRLLIVT
jgi:hypothetical protein